MNRTKGYIFAAISAVSYGMIPYFVIPVKRSGISLNATLFYRFGIAALCLAAIMIYKKISFKFSFRDALIFISLGFFYGAGSDLLFLGYDFLTPGIASTLFYVFPVFVVLMMRIFFKEKIKKLTVAALAIVLSGVYIISVTGEKFSINFLGLSVALMSSFLYASYIVTINKSGLKGSGWWITFYVLLTTTIYFFAKTLTKDDSIFLPGTNEWINLIIFSLVTTVVSVSALTYAIKLIGSTPTAILGALEPVVAVGISVLLFGENLTLRLVAGVILIIIGVIINILADSKKTPQKD